MRHSHGTACLNLLMISKMTTNLSTEWIIISGSVMAPWALANESMYSKYLTKVTNGLLHKIRNYLFTQKVSWKIFKNCLKSFSILIRFWSNHRQNNGAFKAQRFTNQILQSSPSSSSSSSSSSLNSSTLSSSACFGKKSMHYYALISYSLLFKITRVEFPFVITNEEQFSDKILRTAIRNFFDYDQQIIFEHWSIKPRFRIVQLSIKAIYLIRLLMF